ncbi:uncharacterized protein MELLADRAFT_115537 [Melampsora larici-populina 98AG31]|uniref:Uncharacterized protein n=1 Tax=Melampsora larici-populina (strain 98AG31 / pathotype 3-4-7) TaxID=747676 RepID=F4RBF5_MELLP|nr:uncharacterized protein MELLADRAFT_115537 [Melampsora larici-populina 98AG31]EGG10075.1 hypothetical protein MELLADRAFT_115537 [Melampsora larici-populina 98AG31]
MTSLTNELEETQAKLTAAGIKLKKKNQVEGTSKTVTRSQSLNRGGEGCSGSGTTEAETNTGRTENSGDRAETSISQRQTTELQQKEQEVAAREEQEGERGDGQEEETGEKPYKEMTAKEKWWQAIGFAMDTEQDVLATDMLKGFNLMYREEHTGEERRPLPKRARSPMKRREERPRTESLIIGDDDEGEEAEEHRDREGSVEVERGRSTGRTVREQERVVRQKRGEKEVEEEEQEVDGEEREDGAGRGRGRGQPRGSIRGGRGNQARGSGWFQGRGAGWWAKQRGQSNGGSAGTGEVVAKE